MFLTLIETLSLSLNYAKIIMSLLNFSHYFLVKDLTTRELLMGGHNKTFLYELEISIRPIKSLQNITLACSVENKLWHKSLGHPTPKVLNDMLQTFSLSEN